MSFLCPNGTIFRQSHLICDWWFRVECDKSLDQYEESAEQLAEDQKFYKARAEERERRRKQKKVVVNGGEDYTSSEIEGDEFRRNRGRQQNQEINRNHFFSSTTRRPVSRNDRRKIDRNFQKVTFSQNQQQHQQIEEQQVQHTEQHSFSTSNYSQVLTTAQTPIYQTPNSIDIDNNKENIHQAESGSFVSNLKQLNRNYDSSQAVIIDNTNLENNQRQTSNFGINGNKRISKKIIVNGRHRNTVINNADVRQTNFDGIKNNGNEGVISIENNNQNKQFIGASVHSNAHNEETNVNVANQGSILNNRLQNFGGVSISNQGLSGGNHNVQSTLSNTAGNSGSQNQYHQSTNFAHSTTLFVTPTERSTTNGIKDFSIGQEQINGNSNFGVSPTSSYSGVTVSQNEDNINLSNLNAEVGQNTGTNSFHGTTDFTYKTTIIPTPSTISQVNRGSSKFVPTSFNSNRNEGFTATFESTQTPQRSINVNIGSANSFSKNFNSGSNDQESKTEFILTTTTNFDKKDSAGTEIHSDSSISSLTGNHQETIGFGFGTTKNPVNEAKTDFSFPSNFDKSVETGSGEQTTTFTSSNTQGNIGGNINLGSLSYSNIATTGEGEKTTQFLFPTTTPGLENLNQQTQSVKDYNNEQGTTTFDFITQKPFEDNTGFSSYTDPSLKDNSGSTLNIAYTTIQSTPYKNNNAFSNLNVGSSVQSDTNGASTNIVFPTTRTAIFESNTDFNGKGSEIFREEQRKLEGDGRTNNFQYLTTQSPIASTYSNFNGGNTENEPKTTIFEFGTTQIPFQDISTTNGQPATTFGSHGTGDSINGFITTYSKQSTIETNNNQEGLTPPAFDGSRTEKISLGNDVVGQSVTAFGTTNVGQSGTNQVYTQVQKTGAGFDSSRNEHLNTGTNSNFAGQFVAAFGETHAIQGGANVNGNQVQQSGAGFEGSKAEENIAAIGSGIAGQSITASGSLDFKQNGADLEVQQSGVGYDGFQKGIISAGVNSQVAGQSITAFGNTIVKQSGTDHGHIQVQQTGAEFDGSRTGLASVDVNSNSGGQTVYNAVQSGANVAANQVQQTKVGFDGFQKGRINTEINGQIIGQTVTAFGNANVRQTNADLGLIQVQQFTQTDDNTRLRSSQTGKNVNELGIIIAKQGGAGVRETSSNQNIALTNGKLTTDFSVPTTKKPEQDFVTLNGKTKFDRDNEGLTTNFNIGTTVSPNYQTTFESQTTFSGDFVPTDIPAFQESSKNSIKTQNDVKEFDSIGSGGIIHTTLQPPSHFANQSPTAFGSFSTGQTSVSNDGSSSRNTIISSNINYENQVFQGFSSSQTSGTNNGEVTSNPTIVTTQQPPHVFDTNLPNQYQNAFSNHNTLNTESSSRGTNVQGISTIQEPSQHSVNSNRGQSRFFDSTFNFRNGGLNANFISSLNHPLRHLNFGGKTFNNQDKPNLLENDQKENSGVLGSTSIPTAGFEIRHGDEGFTSNGNLLIKSLNNIDNNVNRGSNFQSVTQDATGAGIFSTENSINYNGNSFSGTQEDLRGFTGTSQSISQNTDIATPSVQVTTASANINHNKDVTLEKGQESEGPVVHITQSHSPSYTTSTRQYQEEEKQFLAETASFGRNRGSNTYFSQNQLGAVNKGEAIFNQEKGFSSTPSPSTNEPRKYYSPTTPKPLQTNRGKVSYQPPTESQVFLTNQNLQATTFSPNRNRGRAYFTVSTLEQERTRNNIQQTDSGNFVSTEEPELNLRHLNINNVQTGNENNNGGNVQPSQQSAAEAFALYFGGTNGQINRNSLVTPTPTESGSIVTTTSSFEAKKKQVLRLVDELVQKSSINSTTQITAQDQELLSNLLTTHTRESFLALFPNTTFLTGPEAEPNHLDSATTHSGGITEAPLKISAELGKNDLDGSQTRGLLDDSDGKVSPDLRQLAQVFTKALSAYLDDPEAFRKVLSEIRPTEPALSTEQLSGSNDFSASTKEEEEVLDFSDVSKVTPKKKSTTVSATQGVTATPYKENSVKSVSEIENSVINYSGWASNTELTAPLEETSDSSNSYVTSTPLSGTTNTIAEEINGFIDNSQTSSDATDSYFPVAETSYSVGRFQNNFDQTTKYSPYGSELTSAAYSPLGRIVVSSVQQEITGTVPENSATIKPENSFFSHFTQNNTEEGEIQLAKELNNLVLLQKFTTPRGASTQRTTESNVVSHLPTENSIEINSENEEGSRTGRTLYNSEATISEINQELSAPASTASGFLITFSLEEGATTEPATYLPRETTLEVKPTTYSPEHHQQNQQLASESIVSGSVGIPYSLSTNNFIADVNNLAVKTNTFTQEKAEKSMERLAELQETLMFNTDTPTAEQKDEARETVAEMVDHMNMTETTANTLMKVMEMAATNVTYRRLVLLLVSDKSGKNKTVEETRLSLLKALLTPVVNAEQAITDFPIDHTSRLIQPELTFKSGNVRISKSIKPETEGNKNTVEQLAKSGAPTKVVRRVKVSRGLAQAESNNREGNLGLIRRTIENSKTPQPKTNSLNGNDIVDSDSRAVDLLRSLYSLATRWG